MEHLACPCHSEPQSVDRRQTLRDVITSPKKLNTSPSRSGLRELLANRVQTFGGRSPISSPLKITSPLSVSVASSIKSPSIAKVPRFSSPPARFSSPVNVVKPSFASPQNLSKTVPLSTNATPLSTNATPLSTNATPLSTNAVSKLTSPKGKRGRPRKMASPTQMCGCSQDGGKPTSLAIKSPTKMDAIVNFKSEIATLRYFASLNR